VIKLKEDWEFFVWIEQNYLDHTERWIVVEAWRFACQVHFGQLRRTGRPFIWHPIEVAIELKKLKLSIDYVIGGGLLHDAPEDCKTKKETIGKMFGNKAASIAHFMDKTRLEFFCSYLEKFHFYLERDRMLILPRLADSLCNLREPSGYKNAKNRKLAAWYALELVDLTESEFLPNHYEYQEFFQEIREEAKKYA
jgi:GTP diphosphokinase / guanosine-3',5'-bis(diphosphate) 3'-diphosphatase